MDWKITQDQPSKKSIQRKDRRGLSETQTRKKGAQAKNQDLFINNTRCFHLRKTTALCTANNKIWRTIPSRFPWEWATSNLSLKNRVFWTNHSSRPPIYTWILTTQPRNSLTASIRAALENKQQIRDNLSLPVPPSTKTIYSKTTSKWTKCWSVITTVNSCRVSSIKTPPQIRMWLIRSSTSLTAITCPKTTQQATTILAPKFSGTQPRICPNLRKADIQAQEMDRHRVITSSQTHPTCRVQLNRPPKWWIIWRHSSGKQIWCQELGQGQFQGTHRTR